MVRLFVDAIILIIVFLLLLYVIPQINNTKYEFYFLNSLVALTPAYIMQLLVLFAAFMALAYEIRKHFKWEPVVKDKISVYNDLFKLTPYEFEQYIAGIFRRMGYWAQVTSKSEGTDGGDYGADIIAKKDGRTVLIQVKRWKPKYWVGVEHVRSTLGAMHRFNADKAVLITTSDYTEQAHEQAKGAPIELWDGHYLKHMFEKYNPYK
jgi:HJR/Mrr/RecB family endonuclease